MKGETEPEALPDTDGDAVKGETEPLRLLDGNCETVKGETPMAGAMALIETRRVQAPAPVAAVNPTVAVALPSTAAMSMARVCA